MRSWLSGRKHWLSRAGQQHEAGVGGRRRGDDAAGQAEPVVDGTRWPRPTHRTIWAKNVNGHLGELAFDPVVGLVAGGSRALHRDGKPVP